MMITFRKSNNNSLELRTVAYLPSWSKKHYFLPIGVAMNVGPPAHLADGPSRTPFYKIVVIRFDFQICLFKTFVSSLSSHKYAGIHQNDIGDVHLALKK